MNRTLIFHYKPGQLTQDVNVVVTFQPPTSSEPSSDQNRVAWKVTNLKAVPGSSTSGQFAIKYDERLGFGVARLLDGNTVFPDLMVDMKLGQTTQLSREGNNLIWSEPAGSNGAIIRATNTTDYGQNIVVGTVQDIGGYSVLEPTFLWKVGTKVSVEARFYPLLNMHGLENDFITANLEHLSPIWAKNLANIDSITHFSFFESPQGNYGVTSVAGVLQLYKTIELAGGPPAIHIKVRFRLNWQATVGIAAVSAAFVAIAKICTDAQLNYFEVKNDTSLYRTIGASKNGMSANELHRILLEAVTQSVKKDEAQLLSEDEIGLCWSISDEIATNGSTNDELEGKEDVIVKGSAAWYYLK
ncbi:hypothetical protein GYMLUDRAFT_237061 [Collybiopsis luxurians FD-317 M1]|nr:hypothetical protein GYMLUDRAFT_237061 [Collybiopsis luxurians FD-317 M1]